MTNGLPIKRVTTELDTSLYSLNKKITVEYNYEELTIVVKIDNKEFHLGRNYPFNQPCVVINNRPYSYFLKPPTKRIYKVLQKLNYTCMCCNTILKNWSPMYTMIKLLDEIENFNCIKRAVKYYIAIEELGKKRQIISQIPEYVLQYL